jgi:hypothetical protein
MTPEDRELLLSLRRQQGDLQQTLERLNAQLGALEGRAGAPVEEGAPLLPPLPLEAILPPIPRFGLYPNVVIEFPPIPPTPTVALPPAPVPPPKPSFEFQFGRWLTRMGAVFGVIALALIFALPRIQAFLGHAGLLAVSAIASILVVILGDRMERKGGASLFFGRTIMAMALAWLYLTTYAAYSYEPLHVVNSPLVGGFLLLLWSIYVLLLAERKKSQLLGVFAITLAYISTAINPVGAFTMGADLILAATSAVFLLRNAWAAISYFSLIGTYLALLRRLVVDENGEFVFDTSRTLPFLPHAVYLLFAWLIFTTAIILTSATTFRRAKRFALLSLNNAALAGLLALTAYIAGYGVRAMGWTLLDTGLLFLITSRFAGFAEIEPVDVMGAYAAQGLALFTGGIIVVFTGITRAVLLLAETFLLGVAAAFAGDRILTVSTYVSGFFATVFLIWEIAANAHHPWLLGFTGALVMLINAWNSRSEVRHGPMERSTIVVSSSCYCILALGLIATALGSELSDNALPPALAIAALMLTFLIYYFSIYELPPLAQTLLLAAQFLVLFPAETGEELPWWSPTWVTLVTLIMVTWWSRQRVTRSGSWTITLTFVYALALAGLAHQMVRPYLDAQGWMIGASFLSAAFLVYGAFARVWAVAAVGQLFLALAAYHFFFPPNHDVFPWTATAAAVPVVVIFATAIAAHRWLDLFTDIPESWRGPLRIVAYGYLLLALAALVRWVFGVVPVGDQVAAFLFLGTLVLSTNIRRASTFGVRCSFVLSALGAVLFFNHIQEVSPPVATLTNGFAMLFFLAQTGLLRHEGKPLVTSLESWTHTLLAVGTSWVFVSVWVWTCLSANYLTMGWALFALFLFLFGLIVHETRLRWCGLAVVLAAILRVLCCDMWSFSLGYKVLTLIVLTFITLSIGYMILRRGAAHERPPASKSPNRLNTL